MGATYQFGSNPQIDYPRLLVADTDMGAPIFDDREITAMYQIQAAQFQTSMQYNAPAGQNLPASPVSYLRVAALLLDALASNKARLSSVVGLLDVKLNVTAAAKALRDQAAAYRETDDNSGAFAIIEQVFTGPGLVDRFWSQVQRESGI
jgi:hypothetical protein